MCNVEVAQVRADPLKIISLSRDLFFSFVPGLLSRAGRSPAAQAAQAGPARLSGRWWGGGGVTNPNIGSEFEEKVKKKEKRKASVAVSPKRSTRGGRGRGCEGSRVHP